MPYVKAVSKAAPVQTPGLDFRKAAEFVGRRIAHVEKAFRGKPATRNFTLFSLLTAHPISFFLIALRPDPRHMWAQRWPTLAFVGLFQIALDRCVEIEGLVYLPETGPVILAGNHINKTSMDGMLLGAKILLERAACPNLFQSPTNPPGCSDISFGSWGKPKAYSCQSTKV